MNLSDVNTFTCNVYQIGPATIKTYAFLKLLKSIASNHLFETLRSKEQLGYDVDCEIINNHGILGYLINVQSQETKFSAEYIDERIEAFRATLLNFIRKASDSEFEDFKINAMYSERDDNNLYDEVRSNWAEITSSEYAFDRIIKVVKCLKNITKSEFLVFLLANTSKLSVQVIGRSDANQTDDVAVPLFDERFHQLNFIPMSNSTKGSLIRNIPNFVSNLELYPVTKTNFNC